MPILAGRFENNDTTAALIEQFKDTENIGIRWSLDSYGVQRIEVNIKANGPYDAYDRYANHHGQRLAVYDSSLFYVASGNITGINWLEGDIIQYIAKGPYNRMVDLLDTTQYAIAATVSAAIAAILSNYVAIDDGTTDNIEINATTLNGWQPDIPDGSYPYDAIRDLLNMSDSSFSLYDFWLVDQPINATTLRQFTPYYKKRSTSASPDWVVSRKDIKGLSLGRDIDDFATTKRVYHGTISGTATGGTWNTLADTTRNFLTMGVKPGAQITNITTGGRSRVESVVANTITLDGNVFARGKATGGSTTTLIDTTKNFSTLGVVAGDVVINDLDDSTGTVTGLATTTNPNDTIQHSAMSGGKSNGADESYRIAHVFASGDVYSIKLGDSPKYQEASASTTPYWARETADYVQQFNATQALQYATQTVDTEPQQRQSFIVSSPFIRDGNGAKWPLFAVIAKGGGYIRITDLYPAAAIFTDALNRLTTFRITSLDYDDKTNNLRVGVDTLDTRIDARLRRAKILGSELIARGE